MLILPAASSAEDPLTRGNAAFRSGDFAEAARIYGSEEEGGDRLTRAFNAGVSWSRSGDLDRAIERFEEVSIDARGKLASAARYNAGCAHFQKGKLLAEDAFAKEDREERVAALTAAAQSYQASLLFFQRVEPKDDDTTHNVAAAKTALRAVVDELHRIEEEKRREEEEKALEDPPELLRALQAKEKLHRNVSRTLAQAKGKHVRLGCRRLRRAEEETRALAEKLHAVLADPVPPPPPPPGASPAQPPPEPEESEEEKARREAARAAVGEAIEAMRGAEVAYGKLEPARAVESHTAAVEALRRAREAFPLDIAALLGDAIALQEAVNTASGELAGTEDADDSAGGDNGDNGDNGAKSGIGNLLVDVLEDKVLRPIATALDPRRRDASAALAGEEDDVVWSSRVLSEAQLPPPPPPPAVDPTTGAAPPPVPQGSQGPSAEDVAKINEALAREGKTAHEAAQTARAELAANRPGGAVEPGGEALAALERIRELLPKRPESLEERLAKLIERQRAAREAVAALASLAADAARREASTVKEEEQRTDGKEAGGIAEELEGRQDEPARRAAPEVRAGEADVFTSAEALRRELVDEAGEAIERDIEAFERALAILRGEDQNQGNEEQEDEQEQEDQNEDEQGDQQQPQPQEEQTAYELSPEEARREQERMDRDRREQEALLRLGGSGQTREKDW